MGSHDEKLGLDQALSDIPVHKCNNTCGQYTNLLSILY